MPCLRFRSLAKGIHRELHASRVTWHVFTFWVQALYWPHAWRCEAWGHCKRYFESHCSIQSSATSGPGTAYYFQAECSSHVTTYFRTFVWTFESMLWRGSNIQRENNRPVLGSKLPQIIHILRTGVVQYCGTQRQAVIWKLTYNFRFPFLWSISQINFKIFLSTRGYEYCAMGPRASIHLQLDPKWGL